MKTHLSAPHICGFRDIPLAACTILSALKDSPLSRFVYGEPPPSRLPFLDILEFTRYLYKCRSHGLVLSVDDGDTKCVGIAVWIAPSQYLGVRWSNQAWCVYLIFQAWFLCLSFFLTGKRSASVMG